MDVIEDECSICLTKLSTDKHLQLDQCKHVFHKSCVQEWFKNKFSCPLCKNEEVLNCNMRYHGCYIYSNYTGTRSELVDKCDYLIHIMRINKMLPTRISHSTDINITGTTINLTCNGKLKKYQPVRQFRTLFNKNKYKDMLVINRFNIYNILSYSKYLFIVTKHLRYNNNGFYYRFYVFNTSSELHTKYIATKIRNRYQNLYRNIFII